MTENRSLGSGASYPQRGADAQNPPVSSAVAPLCGALRTARPTLPIWLDWVPLVVLPIAGVSVRGVLPAWVLMWVVAFAIYLSCKWLTWRRATRKSTKARPWRSVGYFLLWPGMDADSFVSPAPKEHSANWIRPGALTMAGVAFLWLAARESLTTQARESLTTQSLWIGWLGMVGLILVLHFGIFELLAVGWRAAGVNVKSVMQAPLRATSLGDFWGRRWNTAFNALAHALAFRPLARRWGKAAATLATFLISGLVHELVISVPARGGYGLPAAYFVFQGMAVLAESSKAGRWLGLGRGLRGWLFTMACVAGPVFWLFHPPFVRNVILPMLQFFGDGMKGGLVMGQ